MNIKKVPVDVCIEYLYCDCGEEMVRNNVVLTTYPCQYSYSCPKCGNTETAIEKYPKIIFIDKEGRVI